MATFTPQAQSGLDYLKTVSPSLAASIQKSFSPSSTTPIDASIIGNSPTISVPPTPTAQTPDYTKVQVSTPAIVNTPEQMALDAQGSQIQNDIVAAGDKLATKSARKSALENDQNIPQLNSQLNEINNLIRGVQNDAFAATNKSEDRKAPTFAILGEQAAIDRQRAVKVYGFAAAAEAIQGNIALANDYVSRTLDAEFGHLEQDIENKKFLLTQNKDKFNREEARAAETRQVELDKQKEALAAAKKDKSDILQIMLTAAQNGADNATLQKIQGARTPQEAAQAAGQVLGAKFADDKAQQAFENNIKLAQLSIDQAKLKNDSAAAVADPATILAYAQQYAATGQIPTGMPKGTFGMVSQLGKELPKPDGTLVSNVTGIAPSGLSAAQTDGIVALRDLQKKLDDSKVLFNSYNHGLLTGVKNAVVPSTASQQYNNLRGEIVDLLARARSGAALTANEEATYLKKLPSNFNNSLFLGASGDTKIDNLKSSITGKLDTALQTHNLSIYGYSTVNVGGQAFQVGQTITNSKGESGRVNADGTITLTQ
jgi:hypothetical protein